MNALHKKIVVGKKIFSVPGKNGISGRNPVQGGFGGPGILRGSPGGCRNNLFFFYG
jgi:hypothetical protein